MSHTTSVPSVSVLARGGGGGQTISPANGTTFFSRPAVAGGFYGAQMKMSKVNGVWIDWVCLCTGVLGTVETGGP